MDAELPEDAMLKKFKAFAENHWVNLLIGLVLFATAAWEIVQDIDQDLGAHHGVLVYGALQVLKSLPDLADSAEKLAHLAE